MRLCDLIYEKETLGDVNLSSEITDIADDARKVSHGCAFFACGVGEKYITHAYLSGAAATVCEVGAHIPKNFPIPTITVGNARRAYALACQRMYGNPADEMTLVAVTGTNGKTSVAMLVCAIAECAGRKTGAIGTIGNFIDKTKLSASYTTPPPRELASLLSRMKDAGTELAVMEASSHALAQHRLDGLEFEVGIFTNLTRDHLDYHKSENEYAAAKARLFEASRHSVINLDDARSKEMAWHAAGDVWYFSTQDPSAEFFADGIRCGMGYTNFTLHSPFGDLDIKTRLTGSFYVYNAALACAAALILGINKDVIASALYDFPPVEGRMETVSHGGVTAVIDFAHTPDALEKTLSTLRPLCSGRLITVFGCGGNRDRGKRPKMGAAAAKYSDVTIITSDNPRSERPEDIIEEIASGIEDKGDILKIPNRAEAVECALSLAERGDTVVVAGKGHEKYIEDALGKHHYSDKEQIENYFKKGK